MMGAAAALTVLVACGPQEETLCSCVELESTVAALGKLVSQNWTSLDQASLARAWPDANPLPCETTPGIGLEAVSEGIQRCCDSCGTCGGPVFRQGDPSDVGLFSIAVGVCRESPDAVLSELKQLVEATLPEELDATYEEGWALVDSREQVRNSYRWHSDNETFILNSWLFLFREQWFGSFEVTRCTIENSSEQWVLDDGTTLDIREAEVQESGDSERELWFSYLSQCLLSDYQCLQSEWRSLWPRLRSMAEQGGASRVLLLTEDCKGESNGVGARLDASGEWDVSW